jgi:hypothetical protein
MARLFPVKPTLLYLALLLIIRATITGSSHHHIRLVQLDLHHLIVNFFALVGWLENAYGTAILLTVPAHLVVHLSSQQSFPSIRWQRIASGESGDFHPQSGHLKRVRQI